MRPTQKLLPAAVPWQVSPSTPFLRLLASEGDEPTAVTFVANFRPSERMVETTVGFDLVEVVEPSWDPGLADDSPEGPWRTVKISFTRGHWARFSPSYGDHEVVDESAYDWTAVSGQWSPEEDIAEHLRRFDELWAETGLCPDPGFYQVIGSAWLEEVAKGNLVYKHYLALGSDAYVEVIAAEATWECGGSSPSVVQVLNPSGT